MIRFIRENWKTLQSAIGNEPSMHILGNAVRKVLGLKPATLLIEEEAKCEEVLGIGLSKYQEYLNQRERQFEERSSAIPLVDASIIWVIASENVKELTAAKNSILRQNFPFAQVLVVCTNRFIAEALKFQQYFSSIEACLEKNYSKYVCFLHNESILNKYYHQEVSFFLSENAQVEIAYVCEDQIDADQTRLNPIFKPDHNEDLLTGFNYMGRNLIVKTEVGERHNWFDTHEFPNAFIYDFLLRASSNGSIINRISDILISLRKDHFEPIEERQKALTNLVTNNAWVADVEHGTQKETLRIKRKISSQPMVSIIIPFRDKLGLLKKCLNSIFAKTRFENYEIILADNCSEKRATQQYITRILKSKSNVKHVFLDMPFNFSAINNSAVKHANGEYLLFLNNDTKVITNSWLSEMVRELQRPKVGVVGAKLLYEDGTLQHAGVLLGLGHVAGHAFRYLDEMDLEHGRRINLTQEYSAVTGACLLTKKKLFQEIGGFDAKNLGVAYNDVDYCLSVKEKGHKVIYTPHAKLYHFESKSRPYDLSRKESDRYEKECIFMVEKWSIYSSCDPFFHPHLDKRKEDFSVR
jgi:GT2 family glycosyltransferase